VRSRTTPRFRERLSVLPEEIRQHARRAYRKFKQDPWHPSLRFQQVHPSLPYYSVRITKGYRAVGKRDEEGMLWFWVGAHSDYDKLLSRL